MDPDDRRRYVRALCRIYLTDYLCAGYPLPAACDGLYEELDTDYRAYEKVRQCGKEASFILKNFEGVVIIPL